MNGIWDVLVGLGIIVWGLTFVVSAAVLITDFVHAQTADE